MVSFAGGLRRPFARYWLSGFLADFGGGIRLASFPLPAAQLTRSPVAGSAVTAVQGLPWLLAGAGATSSAAWALFNLTVVTMRQRQVPAALLGRVTSLYGTAWRGSEVLGATGGAG